MPTAQHLIDAAKSVLETVEKIPGADDYGSLSVANSLTLAYAIYLSAACIREGLDDIANTLNGIRNGE